MDFESLNLNGLGHYVSLEQVVGDLGRRQKISEVIDINTEACVSGDLHAMETAGMTY